MKPILALAFALGVIACGGLPAEVEEGAAGQQQQALDGGTDGGADGGTDGGTCKTCSDSGGEDVTEYEDQPLDGEETLETDVPCSESDGGTDGGSDGGSDGGTDGGTDGGSPALCDRIRKTENQPFWGKIGVQPDPFAEVCRTDRKEVTLVLDKTKTPAWGQPFLRSVTERHMGKPYTTYYIGWQFPLCR